MMKYLVLSRWDVLNNSVQMNYFLIVREMPISRHTVYKVS
jgi:hypothetical protein